MDVDQVINNLSWLDSKTLMRLWQATDEELQARHYRRRDIVTHKALGLIPLYRCPESAHRSLGLSGEDFSRPGYLMCGCAKAASQFVGYE